MEFMLPSSLVNSVDDFSRNYSFINFVPWVSLPFFSMAETNKQKKPQPTKNKQTKRNNNNKKKH